MQNRLVWALLAVVVVSGGVAAYYLVNRPTAERAPAAPPEKPAATVVVGDLSAAPVEPKLAPKTAPTQASVASPAQDPSKTMETGRGRIWGTAKSPGGGEISVALHKVPEGRDTEFSYDENKVGTAIVGADGSFEFTALPLGYYVLLATAPGHTMNGAARLTAERLESQQALVLVPGGPISGRVVNEKHEPVANARVFVGGWDIQGQKATASLDRSLASQRLTNENGEFTIENLRKSLNNEPGYQVAVKAEGYATLLSDYIQQGRTGVELVLKAGNVVSGILVNALSGEAIPDATVLLETAIAVDKLSAKTDAGGFFFISDVAAGTQTAALRDDELVITPETAKIQVADRMPTPDVTLQAAPGGKVSGRVYDTETGAGIGNVEMYANPAGVESVSVKPVKTTGTGTYLFKGLKPGSYRIERRKPDGYPEDYRNPQRTRMVNADLGKETTGVDFGLTRGLVITGRVIDESGRPVAGAWVNSYVQRGGGQDNSQSRADGTFTLAGFATGQTATVSAGKDGFAVVSAKPAKGEVQIKDDGASGVEFVFGEEATLSGTVVGKSGAPKPGVQMWMSSSTQIGGGSVQTSGPDGSVKFGRLAAGEYTFQFNGMPNRSNDPNTQRVTVRKGQKIEGVRIQYPEMGGLTVAGRVRDTKGNGVARANVRVQGGRWREVTADAEGKFTVDGLKEGPVTLSAASYAYSGGATQTARAGDTNVELVLKALAKVEGRVLSAQTGQPVATFQIRATGASGQPYYSRDEFAATNDPEGKFTLTQVEDGATGLEARAEGFADTKVPLTGVVGGETKRDVIVRMNPGVQVAGRVLDPSGAGVGAAQIFIGAVPQEWEQARQQRATSAADGSFKLTSLPAGSVTISASHPKFAPKTVTANLSAGSENKLDIVLSAGGAVEGIVTVDQQPAVGANIYASGRNGGSQYQAQTDAKGHYRLAGLPDGPLNVNAQVSAPSTRGRSKNAQVQVADGMVIDANFDFVTGTSIVEGAVFEGPGQPYRGELYVSLNVAAPDGGAENFGVQVDSAGGFSFANLPPGQAILLAYAQGRTKRLAFEIGQGQRIHKDIELFGGATLHVTLSGSSAGVVQSVLLLIGSIRITDLRSQAPLFQSQIANNAQLTNGQGVLTAIEPGTYTLLVLSHDPGAAQTLAIHSPVFAGRRKKLP